MIEASLAKQYGIRIRQHSDMPWAEFCTLVAGLMPDTPLGSVVSIRSETDPKAIKAFNTDQRRIYNEWRNRRAKAKLSNPAALEQEMRSLEAALARMFGGDQVVR
ncbi:Gp15 family bacteriophage protein [Cohnella sp. GbtcB17]|uniref:Gp15 family bacteriophage protein n=1 Tax=Cohnella sp. GbtcB17 TaxID=2824762 RepID=UPI0020C6238E|nr:Gp15 family bacteriophage protein [Cohnella sp. GbtcB17]